MKPILRYTFLFFALTTKTAFSQTGVALQSPDGAYRFVFYQKNKLDSHKQMYYSVKYKNRTVIEESELGILIDNKLFENALAIPNDNAKNWCDNLQLAAIERHRVNESWKPVYGERNDYPDNYNELILKFEKGKPQNEKTDNEYNRNHFYRMNIVVRAYNEGVAFRYAFPQTDNGLFLHITGEQTQFTLPESTLAYYEMWAQGPYLPIELKDWKEESERPLTMKLANELTVAISEAEMTGCARMKLKMSDTNTLQASLYGEVDATAPYQTPWRVIMAAEKPAQLIENNYLILNLNKPCKIKNTEWIKPGKAIRITRLNQKDALKFIDFAAERGLQYVHLDAGWYGKEMLVESDATKADILKDINIQELVKYAEKKNIGLWLYVNQRALSRQLDEILPLYEKWGIKGIKFGFVQVGNQYWTAWLHNAVQKCAEYGLMVDIHDEYRPTGFSRTFPNLLTQEGIRGNEEFPDATHNTILPFTRYLAGAADYTICYYDKRIKTTHAHQLALAVVYYSPLQFLYWYDTPDVYRGEPEIEFFDRVKTVWDDTKVIDGAIGEYIITARRSGNEWFLGAITNTEARKLQIPLSFLDDNKRYVATLYCDDDSATTRTKVAIKKLEVTNKTMLTETLQASGGMAVIISLQNQQEK
jgi:alpha-glucosidase